MALKVWLPLNGDLRNQGCSDIEVTNNGATVNTAGKIGSCYSFGTSNSYMTLPPKTMTSFTTACSVSFWFKILTWNTAYATYFQAGKGGAAWNNYIFGFLRNNTNSTICFTISNGSTASNASYLTSTISLNTWYHVVLVYKTGKCQIYLNGVLDNEYTTSIVPNFSAITKITIGASNATSSYQANYLLNDFRIYDHALSIVEIHEIAQGLVLHYKLNSCHSNNINLITNGYGEQGTLNWTNTSGTSTDVPSGHTEIKQSFKSNVTVDYIPINIQDQYEFEIYIKGTASSGTVYPSFYPYDIDKNFIENYQCKDGFNLSTMTTITQTLNPGDTQIHVASLVNWNANSGHYYNYAAIFKYKDSFGHLYADGEYTRNTPAFGTSTNAKTNLDKTNNIITLNSAYTGPQIAVGTSICASTAGSTFYYPFGGIAQTSITDWTYKSITFVPQEKNRLKYARYIKFYTYINNLTAGIKLTNITLQNSIIDSSGYGHNGTITGDLQIFSNTSRYNNSAYYNGSSTIMTATPMADIRTLSCWCKTTKNKSTSQFVVADSFSNMCISFYQGTIIGVFGSTRSTGSKSVLGDSYKENDWNHIVVVKTGDAGERDIYCNGIKLTPTSNDYWSVATGFFVGTRNTSNALPFYGQISDIRAYVTPLLDTDIKMLYNMGMKIDNSGAIHTFEYDETSVKNKLTKSGILQDNIIEQYLTLNDGSHWKLMLSHYVDNGRNLFTSSNATDCNELGLYSRLKDINNYTYDNKYEFYVIQDGKEFRWTQTSQPTASSCTGLTTVSGYTNPQRGLAKAGSANTYLGYGVWWGACGCWTSYSVSGKTGIPGFGPASADGICTDYLILYTRIDNPKAQLENTTSYATNFIEM